MMISNPQLNLFIVFACHNRRQLTARLLEFLEDISGSNRLRIQIHAVDDGSSDGTGELLTNCKLVSKLITGDGNLFWAKSMHLGIESVLEIAEDEDAILLLNDDVLLAESGFYRAINEYLSRTDSVIVGATSDRFGEVTYGGMLKHGLHPLDYRRVVPNRNTIQCDTLNGNFVLLSARTFRKIGNLDGSYSHGFADIEFGLRAKKLGIGIYLSPEYVGLCERNEKKVYQRRREAWAEFTNVKGPGNPKSLYRALKSTTKVWVFYFFLTYVLWWSRRVYSANGYTS